MDEKQKVNLIAKQLGKTLIERGLAIYKMAFKLSPSVETRTKFNNAIVSTTDLQGTSLSDENYYVENWNNWLNIIEFDWTDEKAWYKDYYDCDNHAFTFASRMGEIFDLNTAGVCYGNIYDLKTGNLIGGHAFNLIIAKENGVMTPFLYEPLTGKWTKWDKNAKNSLGNWHYTINWMIFY